MRWISRRLSCGIALMLLAGRVSAQPAPQPVSILDVPYISQTETLCGGAAAAMVLRYWGERGVNAETFAHLVDRSAAGIRTDALVADLRGRGWNATAVAGSDDLLAREIERGRPVLSLIEDRPGTFHYVVVVASLPKAVIFHDPARASFRVVRREEFDRRWRPTNRWMAVVVPGNTRSDLDARVAPESSTSPSSCDGLIASGIQRAQANDLDGAERNLTAALSCPGAVALRELAGVRVLQRRWPEVGELASAAVAEDPRDEYAWRLLATSRFVQNDPRGALEAWNRIGEPRLDLVTIDGLSRTRQPVVRRLAGVDDGVVLTPSVLTRTRRRLGELPSATATRLEFVPATGGLAELRGSVSERPLLPPDAWSYAAIGLTAAVQREIEVSTGAVTGGGERLSASWRFWPRRPRVGLTFDAPAPWGGVWGIDAFVERQPFQADLIPTSRRTSVHATVSNWTTARMRGELRAGADRWRDRGAFASIGGSLRWLTADERAEATAAIGGWSGDERFVTVELGGILRSKTERLGRVFVARAGVSAATTAAPADIWFGGDTGHARPVLLRAHPLLDEGALKVAQIGRRLTYASLEAQRFWRYRFATRLGAAAFVDTARVNHRLMPGATDDVDVGVGARLVVPGVPGVFRLDAAKGLRDGATALSLVFERSAR